MVRTARGPGPKSLAAHLQPTHLQPNHLQPTHLEAHSLGSPLAWKPRLEPTHCRRFTFDVTRSPSVMTMCVCGGSTARLDCAGGASPQGPGPVGLSVPLLVSQPTRANRRQPNAIRRHYFPHQCERETQRTSSCFFALHKYAVYSVSFNSEVASRSQWPGEHHALPGCGLFFFLFFFFFLTDKSSSDLPFGRDITCLSRKELSHSQNRTGQENSGNDLQWGCRRMRAVHRE